ncbi:FAD-dependent monooxygenase [Nocardia sp. NPDC051787]|uniref:FAD-dependent monooxygenase n=1 Tax=Nocardia sp. NPDC051787 TaxID=3155415 RepID=UPI0034368AA9
MNEVPVLIAGGGPVGMTLALDLGWRGVPCLLVEETDRTLAVPRASSVSARSMEHFRRLGIARRIRSSGLPTDYPTDVSYRTRIRGPELHRITLPSSAQVLAAGGRDHTSPTAEPAHRISQLYLEPILLEHSRNCPHVRVERGTRLEGFEETADGIRATVRSLSTGMTRVVHADYLVGCDGGNSLVRRRLGAKLTGTDTVFKAVSVYFRAPELAEIIQPRTWMTWSVNRDALCVTVAINGHDMWLVHAFLPADTDTRLVDPGTLITQAIGSATPREIVGVERWTGRRLIADRYGSDRAFIAGDAAHLWIPMAGMGMNTGISEAAHLAWMLSAVHAGWAGPRLLAAYEAERRPVAETISGFATGIGKALLDLVTADVDEDDSPVGEASRRQLGRDVAIADQDQYRPIGLSFGYHYYGSPLLAEDQPPPEFTISTYHPSTAPGARLPHLTLADGTGVYDHLGQDFTLLRIGQNPPDPEPILRAAAERAVPVAVLDLPSDEAVERYSRRLILVRPDQHVAWRADAVPAQPESLIDRIRGAGLE